MDALDEIEEEPEYSVEKLGQMLRELQEIVVSMSIQAKGAVLEELEETEKVMKELDAVVRKISMGLEKAVSDIVEGENKEADSAGTTKGRLVAAAGAIIGAFIILPYMEMAVPSTGQLEMKQLKKIRNELEALLNTSKELSSRLCVELKEIETMISNKRMEAAAARMERKEERLEVKEQERLAAEEESREWEEARRAAARVSRLT